MVRQFHEGMMARRSEWVLYQVPCYKLSQQGCVLVPTLFSVMISVMLHDAFSNNSTVVGFNYQFDRSLFNRKSLQEKNGNLRGNHRNFLFAYDCALAVVNRPTYNTLWTYSLQHVTTLVWPSPPGRQKSCTNLLGKP